MGVLYLSNICSNSKPVNHRCKFWLVEFCTQINEHQLKSYDFGNVTINRFSRGKTHSRKRSLVVLLFAARSPEALVITVCTFCKPSLFVSAELEIFTPWVSRNPTQEFPLHNSSVRQPITNQNGRPMADLWPAVNQQLLTPNDYELN